MSPDLLSGTPGYPQSWNRYSYVRNNPLNSIDPSGMCDEDDTSDCDDSGDSSNSGPSGSVYQPPIFQGLLETGFQIMGDTSVQTDYGGYLLPNGDWYLEGGFTNIPWWSLDGHRWTADGNIFHTPTMAERGMGEWAAALPLAARQAEPGVNLAGTVLQLFGVVAGGASMDEPLGTINTVAVQPRYLYYYTDETTAGLIETSQLGLPGRTTYLTPNGGMSPLQAQLELALPQRNSANVVFRISTEGLDPAKIAMIRRVTGNVFQRPGGGTEVLYNGPISLEYVWRIR